MSSRCWPYRAKSTSYRTTCGTCQPTCTSLVHAARRCAAHYPALSYPMVRCSRSATRMAFKDAWPAARAKYGDQVEVSLGHHKASRAAAVLDAVRTGLIEQRAARLLLPQLTDAEFAGMQRSQPSQTGAFAADPSRQRLRAGGQLVHRAGVWPPSGGRQISWPIISGPLFTRSKRRGMPPCATLRNS